MRYFEKNKRFVILKYLSPDFNSFTNIKIAEVKNMLCYVYDFDTIEEFNKIINSLYGRYIFFDQDNKKTFLYHKKSLIKPFKKIVLNDFKKVSKVDNSCLFEQIGGDKFSVCKKGNFVGVSDQFGRDVSSKFKKFLPDFRGSSIKSFIILGFFNYIFRIGGNFRIYQNDAFFRFGNHTRALSNS